MRLIEIFIRNNRRAVLALSLVIGLAVLVVLTGRTSARSDTGSLSPATVEGRRIRVVSTTASAGGQVTVSIELDSEGDEVASSFTLNFDPAIFSNPVITLGSAAPGGSSLSTNSNQAGTGKLGILVDSTSPFTFGPSRQIVSVTFNIAAGAPAGASAITFVTSPTPLSVSSPLGALLPTIYEVGTVTISSPNTTLVTIGGRVTTPTGVNIRNAVVSLIDSNNVRRTATTSSFGLYSFADVETGSTYTLTVASKRYRFAPIITAITDSVSNLDFVGLE
jgi:hypothetical protein